MGNLQGSENKPSKNLKSPGKANRLIKNRFARGKKNQEHFTGLVPEEEEHKYPRTPEEEPKTDERTSKRNDDRKIHEATVNVSSTLVGGGKETNELAAEQRHSGESSSDTVFTDPLTPTDFSAEINQCYYSEENILDAETNVINNFKLNEYIQEEFNKKLNKLGISKTSQISLDNNCSEDIVIVDMPKSNDTNENGVDDTQEPVVTGSRRSSYYRPRKIELIATRITPVDVGLISSGMFTLNFKILSL